MRRAAVATTPRDPEPNSTRGREVGGIVLLGVALFAMLSLGSFQFGKGNLMGPVGAAVALAIYALLGVGAYLAVWGIGYVALRCLTGGSLRPRWTTVLAGVVGVEGIVMILHLVAAGYRMHGHAPGGLVGEYTGELLVSLIGKVGTAIFATVAMLCAVVLMTPLSLRGVAQLIVVMAKAAAGFAWDSVRAIFPERDEHDEEHGHEEDEERDEQDGRAERALIAIERRNSIKLVAKKKRRDDTEDEELATVDEDVELAPVLAPPSRRPKKKRDDEAQIVELQEMAAAMEADELRDSETMVSDRETALAGLDAPAKAAIAAAPVPMIVQVAPPVKKPKEIEKAVKAQKPDFIPAAGGYHLPSLDLLDYEEPVDSGLDKSGMLTLAERLQKTLADYGVKGQVVQIHPGPVVTMYEVKLVDGTKLTKVTGLSSDLAMALEAHSIRIVAPIPGKGTIGIEVPNKSRNKVFLKEILIDELVNKAKSKLTLGLGKDIAGLPVAVDLAKMPHLLVAGTTGSGKSVSVNGMICSMLFNATPEEVRMIMIDPKMVELSIYEGIPHLLLPVVTDPKKANLALKWAVDEMERRYELVSKTGVRDLVSYNKKIEKIIEAGPPQIEDHKIIISLAQEDGSTREVEVDADEQAVRDAGGIVDHEVRDDISRARAAHQAAVEKANQPLPRKLPYIVVVIDEFADLMMVAPKDVETSVARIAQKARAVGIHLILATQRPSVDVITGLIKANFPSRIAFQVASKIDSRTVLDQSGAESLLGQGDSLFSDRGSSLKRIHGALVTEEEIKATVDFLKTQGQPVYDMDILKPRDNEDEEGSVDIGGGDNKDEMYDQAVRLVCETRMASVSMIQRRLQVGFNRAARMVEQMEKEGIVGAANGSKPREVISQAI